MRNLFQVMMLLFITAGLTAAAGPLAEADAAAIKTHVLEKKGGNWTWVFYGDSITHGAAHTDGWRSFPEIFGEMIRYEHHLYYDVVVNTGISGQTALELTNPQDYEWRVRRFRPNVVFILIGCNDIVRFKDAGGVAVFRQRLEKLVDMVRADGAIPVLQTYNTIKHFPNPKDDNERRYLLRYNEFPAYNDAIRQVAAAKDTILVDHRKHWEEAAGDAATLNSWLGEPIHPGGKGHQEMAIVIAKTLDIYTQKLRSLQLPVGKR